MDPIGSVREIVLNAPLDYNLTAQVRAPWRGSGENVGYHRDYFWVTELVTPSQTYWRREAPGVRRPQALVNRLELGKQRHRIAGYWFARHPSFELAEGNLNGAYVGVPDIVGKFDFLLGSRILEFKSKPVTAISDSDVTTHYLHDLEQLAFYSALSVDSPKVNSLCFLGSGPPETSGLFAYKVTINDSNAIREVLRRRVTWLRAAIAAHDSSGMPPCPYYRDLCEFESVPCSCVSGIQPPLESILRYVTVERDTALEAELSACRRSAFHQNDGLTIRDLMFPRQRYHSRWEYEPSDDFVPYPTPPEREVAKTLCSSAIYRADLVPPKGDRDIVYQAGDAEVATSRSFIWANVPGSPNARDILPLLVRPSSAENVPQTPTDYHLAELALTCGRAGKSEGVIGLGFTRNSLEPALYLVRFRADRLRTFYREAKEQVSVALRAGDPRPLPPCLFMGSCPFAGCQCKQDLAARAPK